MSTPLGQEAPLSRRSLLLATAASLPLLAACSLVPDRTGSSGTAGEQDPRFERFTEYVPEPLQVRTDVEVFTVFVPRLQVLRGSYVAQYWQEPREILPPQDRPLWINAVLEVDAAAATTLTEAASGPLELLPPLYPALHPFVPEGTGFSKVEPDEAERLTGAKEYKQGGDTTWLEVQHLAVCAPEGLVLLVAQLLHT